MFVSLYIQQCYLEKEIKSFMLICAFGMEMFTQIELVAFLSMEV